MDLASFINFLVLFNPRDFMKNYWVKKIGYKKGTLHHQLGIPKEKKLPDLLLKRIMKAKIGDKIKKTISIFFPG